MCKIRQDWIANPYSSRCLVPDAQILQKSYRWELPQGHWQQEWDHVHMGMVCIASCLLSSSERSGLAGKGLDLKVAGSKHDSSCGAG